MVRELLTTDIKVEVIVYRQLSTFQDARDWKCKVALPVAPGDVWFRQMMLAKEGAEVWWWHGCI